MKHPKHTPAPWRACKEGNCKCGIIWDTGKDIPIASIISSEDEVAQGRGLLASSEDYKANIKIVSAAPAMFQALVHVLKEHGNRAGATDTLLPVDLQKDELLQVWAAIEKACPDFEFHEL